MVYSKLMRSVVAGVAATGLALSGAPIAFAQENKDESVKEDVVTTQPAEVPGGLPAEISDAPPADVPDGLPADVPDDPLADRSDTTATGETKDLPVDAQDVDLDTPPLPELPRTLDNPKNAQVIQPPKCDPQAELPCPTVHVLVGEQSDGDKEIVLRWQWDKDNPDAWILWRKDTVDETEEAIAFIPGDERQIFGGLGGAVLETFEQIFGLSAADVRIDKPTSDSGWVEYATDTTPEKYYEASSTIGTVSWIVQWVKSDVPKEVDPTVAGHKSKADEKKAATDKKKKTGKIIPAAQSVEEQLAVTGSQTSMLLLLALFLVIVGSGFVAARQKQ
ncbi:MAG: hypothetical protein Q4P66_04060 [Actinomycetaceae bacterium]|nr:hypothetical protein [Actinomycetaceae bacterium]